MMTRTSIFSILTVGAIGVTISMPSAIGKPMTCFNPKASSKVGELGGYEVPQGEHGIHIPGPVQHGLASTTPVAEVYLLDEHLCAKNLIDREIDVTFYNHDFQGQITMRKVPPNGLKTERLISWISRNLIVAEVAKIYEAPQSLK